MFDSLTEQVFDVKDSFEQAFSEQVFDLRGEHLYAHPHVSCPHSSPTRDSQCHFHQHARARLSAQRPRNRRGRRPQLPLHGAQPLGHSPKARIHPPRPHQASSHRSALRHQLRSSHGTSPVASCPPHRRSGSRNRPSCSAERGRSHSVANRLHGRRRTVHVARPWRQHDQRWHSRWRLHCCPSAKSCRQRRHRCCRNSR